MTALRRATNRKRSVHGLDDADADVAAEATLLRERERSIKTRPNAELAASTADLKMSYRVEPSSNVGANAATLSLGQTIGNGTSELCLRCTRAHRLTASVTRQSKGRLFCVSKTGDALDGRVHAVVRRHADAFAVK